MEHRWSERTPVFLTVTVLSRGITLFSTTTRNLSRQGALLHAHPNQLGQVRSVELQFDCGSGRKRNAVRLPAYVIHRKGGIGLMFTEHSNAAVRELDRLRRQYGAEPAQARGG